MAIRFLENIALDRVLPSQPNHVVTIEWVENYLAGKLKDPVRVVDISPEENWIYTAATQTLTAVNNGEYVVDSVNLAATDRVLIAPEAGSTLSGIYTVTSVGTESTPATLVRAGDFAESSDVFTGMRITVTEGATFGNTVWQLMTSGDITLDETVLRFEQREIAPEVTTISKYADTIIGDGESFDFEIDHNLGTTDVIVSVKDEITSETVMTSVTTSDVNTVVISFGIAPTIEERYRVVIMG